MGPSEPSSRAGPGGPPAAMTAAVIVTLSGACALLYQVVWERLLRNSLGGDSVSSAIVATTFLLGLGLGAVVFGRSHARPLRVYGAVQAGLGLYAMASGPLIGSLGERLAGWGLGSSAHSVADLYPITVLASVLLLLGPCVLIGGTGPMMFDAFVRPSHYGARTVGWLYGLNTAGAALGALAGPFLLLNRMGIGATLRLAGGVNLALAVWLWWLGRRPPMDERLAAAPADSSASGRVPLVLGLAAVSGMIALGFEIVLIRATFTLNPSSPYNFPVVLAVYLLAFALGSIVTTRRMSDDARSQLLRVGALFVASAWLMVLGAVASGVLTLARVHPELQRGSPAWALLAHGLVLGVPMPLVAGGIFPLLLRLSSASSRALPARSAAIYLVNAIGAGAGGLLTQFVGFPRIGTRGVILLAYLLGLGVGVGCLWLAGRRRLLPLALAGLATLAVLASPLAARVWTAHTFGLVALNPDSDTSEGVSGTAAILWGSSAGAVFANGQLMSILPDHERHAKLAAFALVLPARERVLLLGLGGAAVLRDLLEDPAVGRVHAVDWSHELLSVLDGSRARAALGAWREDPRVILCVCDARVAVRQHAAASFDVVIDNLAFANWVGATAVKSVEYFRLVRRVLAPDGVFVYAGNFGTARAAILAALSETFPVVSEHGDGVVYAASEPIRINPGRVATLLTPRAARLGLRPEAVSAWFFEGFHPVPRAAAPTRDDLLVHEYRRDPLGALVAALGGSR